MNRQGLSEVSLEFCNVWNPRVLMVGPSLQEEGGMGTVSRLILNNVKDLRFHHIASWNNVPGSTKLPSKGSVIKAFVSAIGKLLAELLFSQVDLLHFHMAERGSTWRTVVFALITYLFDKPVIIHTHGAEFHEFYNQLPNLHQAIIKKILQKASYVIVLSESWQDYYVSACQLSPKKVIVLHNPVEYPAIAPKRPENQLVKLLFLGKVTSRKGIYDLLQSLAILKRNCPVKFQLLLAGSGEIKSVIQKAEQLGINQNIDVLGWVDSSQVNDLLAEADCFILPSYNEGLPMALLEAMSWALPIVTTPVGGIGEVIKDGENGLLVEPGNIQQLTEAIRLLLTDSEQRLNLGIKARNTVAEFSIDNYTRSLSTLYSKAIENCHN